MYLPEAFAVTDEAEINDLLRRTPFGSLVTHGPRGLFATPLPLLHDPQTGVLAGHMARANPHRDLADDGEAMVIFLGLNTYVSPNWYPSKAVHGRVVPTWNYETVHVYGRICWREDADWLRANVAALTERFEAGQPRPWAIDDAPAAFVDRLLDGVIGVELRIERIEAKRKLSQNRSEADRQGVISALAQAGSDQDRALASAMRASPPDRR
jgi:transcriptional regulator